MPQVHNTVDFCADIQKNNGKAPALDFMGCWPIVTLGKYFISLACECWSEDSQATAWETFVFVLACFLSVCFLGERLGECYKQNL